MKKQEDEVRVTMFKRRTGDSLITRMKNAVLIWNNQWSYAQLQGWSERRLLANMAPYNRGYFYREIDVLPFKR